MSILTVNEWLSLIFSLAQRHKLVGNCLWCGKIICEQEGPGPCLFCGHATGDEGRRDRSKARSEEFHTEASDEELARALERKDRLLEYERSSAQRTVVYGNSFLYSFFTRMNLTDATLADDQQDYFSVDSSTWLSPAEKKLLEKQQEELRRRKEEASKRTRVTFDFAGRRVVATEGT